MACQVYNFSIYNLLSEQLYPIDINYTKLYYQINNNFFKC